MNTVKKGANRATAAASTNRHAQRTPLPPRPGDVAAAREAIREAGEILFDEEIETLTPGEQIAAAVAEAAREAGDAPDVRSWGKAKAFAELGVASKWQGSMAAQGNGVELTLRRGVETIVQVWRGGVWQYAESIYAHADRVTKPRNASGAMKLLARSPEDAAREASKVASNKSFRKAEPRDLAKTLQTAQASLPFAPHDAEDVILDSLRGRSIEWYNRLSRKAEDGVVSPGRHLRLLDIDGGERVLLFCCPRNGFRSCLLSAILAVGSRASWKEDSNA